MAAHRRRGARWRRACQTDGRRRLPAALPRGRCAMISAGHARTVLNLARVEALLLIRSLLVLAGLLASGAVVWVVFGSVQPLWWNAAWQIGFGQLILGLVVLAAAQLAAGRARREGMADLYTSFPVTAGTRTVAHLASLAGAAPASLLLIDRKSTRLNSS